MAERTSPVPAYPWWSLVPSLLILGLMAAWGLAVYPQLPDRIPRHIGGGGVTALWDKTPLTVFLVVLVFVGMTVLLAGCAAGVLRQTPADELAPATDPWVAASRAMNTNRPANARSALRTAHALLHTNALFGLALLPPLSLTWRTSGNYDTGPWTLVGTIGLIVVACVPVLVAAWRDRQERKAAEGGTATGDG